MASLNLKFMPRIRSPIYEKSIGALSAKLFNSPTPDFEPFTFLVVDSHRRLPLEKNRAQNPWYYHPPTYNTKRVLQYLDEKNLFVDEAWRYKMRMWRSRYIKGKQPTWSNVKWTLTDQEKQMMEAQQKALQARKG